MRAVETALPLKGGFLNDDDRACLVAFRRTDFAWGDGVDGVDRCNCADDAFPFEVLRDRDFFNLGCITAVNGTVGY